MSLENNWSFDFKFRNDPSNEALQAFVEQIITGDLRFDDDKIGVEQLDGGVIRLFTTNNGYSTRSGFYTDFSDFLMLVSPLAVEASHVQCFGDGEMEDFYVGPKADVAALKSKEALAACRKEIKVLTQSDLLKLQQALTARMK